MADLTLWHWEKYAPSLGGNKQLEQPFYLRVKAGLTKAQYQAWLETKAKTAEEVTASLEGIVEMGDEPLSIGGQPIATLAEYVAIIHEQKGHELLEEMMGAVAWHNTVGVRANFSERLSGGKGSTVFGVGGDRTAASTAQPGIKTNH
jgi:hypothetical protein